jgi:hypothetical protein
MLPEPQRGCDLKYALDHKERDEHEGERDDA